MKIINYLAIYFGFQNENKSYVKVETVDFDGQRRIRIAKRLRKGSIRV